MTPSVPAVVAANPFVGPRALRSGEALYGRDREVRRLTDLLVAERIVLLYSPSGAGKTSLIQAGLIPELRRRRFQVSPVIRVSQVSADHNVDENRYLVSTLQALEAGLRPNDQRSPAELLAMGLDGYVREWAELDERGAGNELLIFDQFEEVLVLDPGDDQAKRQFFRNLGGVLEERDRWALFSMREDYIAGLDPYLGELPTRLFTRMRLDLLPPEAALRAVTDPAAAAQRPFDDAAAERLVHDLRMVQAQRGGEIVWVPGPVVEPLQLQVVCRRLWEALPDDVQEITEADVTRFARVQTALAEYYAEEVRRVAEKSGVPERAIREWFGDELVTDRGVRRQQQQGPGPDPAAGERAVSLLEDAYLVRAEARLGTRWLELAHDRLVDPIQSNNAEWVREHLSPVQRQAQQWAAQQRPPDLLLTGQLLVDGRRWAAKNPTEVTELETEFLSAADRAEAYRRWRRRSTVLIPLTAVLTVALFIAGYQWRNADAAAGEAASRAYAAKAIQFVTDDPMRAVAIAERALDRAPTNEAEDALRQAMSQDLPTAVLAHGDEVASAAFSPRGDRLITSSWDQTVRIWDSTTGTQLDRRHYDGGVLDARFSPDGESVLALTNKGVLTVDRPNGAELAVENVWTPVTFNDDGSRVAVTNAATKEVRIFDVASRTEALPPLAGNTSTIRAIAFSADGGLIATAGQDGTARVWDTATGRPLANLEGHAGGVTRVAFRADTTAIATADDEGTVRIWPIRGRDLSGPPLVVRSAQQDGSARIVFNRAGQLLAYGDKSPRLFDSATGAMIRAFDGHRDGVLEAWFTADGQRAVTASRDGTARVWDLASGRELAVLQGTGGSVRGVAVTQGGSAVAVISVTTVGLFQLNEQLLRTDSPGRMRDATFLLGGTTVAAGDQNGRVTVWNVVSKVAMAELKGSDASIGSIDADRSGRYIAAAAEDNTVTVWDWRQRTVAARLQVLASAPDVHFDPSGEILVVAGESVKLWRWRSAEEPRVLSDYPSNTVAFSPDGQYMAIVNNSRDNSVVELWTPTGTRPDKTMDGHTDDVLGVAFSPDGSRLVSASLDGTARIWRTDADHSVATLEGHHGAVMTAAFDDRAGLVVTGGIDGAIGVWDAATARQLAMVPRHTGTVNSVQFSPGDHPRILSASDDTTVRILDCATCRPLEELRGRATRLRQADERGATRQPAVGDCFLQFAPGQDPVDCTSPHRDEVFAVLDYSTSDQEPSAADVDTWARDQCTGSRYTGYRGEDQNDDSEYYTWWSVPRALEWDLGQRHIVCVLTPRDQKDRTQPVAPPG
jgi:WD40 repeat protein